MTRKKGVSSKDKISPEFAGRLEHLRPRQEVRAIVLLQTALGASTSGKRQTREQREAISEALCQSTKEALDEVDGILARFHGQRLAERPDVLGSLPVETTASGLRALAASKWVKAIMEDQDIHLIQ